MLKEKSYIRQGLDAFLEGQNETHGCLLIGFDHDQGRMIVFDVLAPYLIMKNCRFLRIDFDYLCWSPDHFRERTQILLNHFAENLSYARKARTSVKTLKECSDQHGSNVMTGFLDDLEEMSEQHGLKTVVFGENIDRLQVFFHYHGYQDVFRELADSLTTKSHVYVILTGRPAFRRENSYASFFSSHGLKTVWIQPMTSSEIQHWFEEHGQKLSSSVCEHIFEMTNGLLVYLPFIEEMCAAMPDRQEQKILERLNRFGDEFDEQGKLDNYLRCRYFLSLERAKGVGGIRTILSLLARQSGLNLSQVASLIHKSPAATKDYLDSLCEIGLILKQKKVYTIMDPVLGQWIKVNEHKWFESDLSKHLERLSQKPYKHILSDRKQPNEIISQIKKTGKKVKDQALIECD
ncbi:winged helix-turn-helix domain-containing protein [bacterium]|nr:winged helix-turn-helix domain-containing protein [bacterium]